MARKSHRPIRVQIVYTDRSPRWQKQRDLRQAQIVTISQANHANVLGTILEDEAGHRYIFDRAGNYLFTVPASALKRAN